MSRSSDSDGLSYFEFMPRREQPSSSSPPISPGASLARSPVPMAMTPTAVRPSRPSPQSRPYSDSSAVDSRVKVLKIEEGAAATTNVSTANIPLAQPASVAASRGPITSLSRTAGSPLQTQSAGSNVVDRPKRHRPELDSTAADFKAGISPPRRARPGHTWSRSKSGSHWFERLKQSPGHSKESSLSSQGEPTVPKRLLTPLRPPLSPFHAPVYHHSVKVETSFTNLKPDKLPHPKKIDSPQIMTPETKTSSRRSSIDPRKLFSAPLRLVRKLSTTRKLPVKAETGSKKLQPGSPGKLSLPDHKSLLRRNLTANALRQVSSILEQANLSSGACFPTAVSPPPSRSMSNRPGSWQDSKHEKKMAKGSVATSVVGQQSLQDLFDHTSQTSSQMELGRGVQLNTTPDERATYKIKRTPSADTEEFLKVDISIRGGTSYLPSEARRIHTPPLPQDGLDGKRRGFFFDYNAPESNGCRRASVTLSANPNTPSKLPCREVSKTSTISRRALTFDKKTTRAKAGDWYDAKLAELETDDETSHFPGQEPKPEGRGRSTTTTTSGSALAEAKRRMEKELFDYTIPEHLPSSPLCPRNRKYWRIVKGQGSQWRGCWMHGVGEWE